MTAVGIVSICRPIRWANRWAKHRASIGMSPVREQAFHHDEIELLGEVAKQIAIAAENARAYRTRDPKSSAIDPQVLLTERLMTKR